MGNVESNNSPSDPNSRDRRNNGDNNDDGNENGDNGPTLAQIGLVVGGAIVGGATLAAGISKLLSKDQQQPSNTGNMSPEASGPSSFGRCNTRSEDEKPSYKFRLNTDAKGVGDKGEATCGGVLRNDKGDWVWGFAEKLGVMEISEAELHAVHRGLTLLDKYGVTDVLVETDNEGVAAMLRDGARRKDFRKEIIKECSYLINKLGVTVKYVPRVYNRCANMMAVIGRQQTEDFKVYEHPPHPDIPYSVQVASGTGYTIAYS